MLHAAGVARCSWERSYPTSHFLTPHVPGEYLGIYFANRVFSCNASKVGAVTSFFLSFIERGLEPLHGNTVVPANIGVFSGVAVYRWEGWGNEMENLLASASAENVKIERAREAGKGRRW